MLHTATRLRMNWQPGIVVVKLKKELLWWVKQQRGDNKSNIIKVIPNIHWIELAVIILIVSMYFVAKLKSNLEILYILMKGWQWKLVLLCTILRLKLEVQPSKPPNVTLRERTAMALHWSFHHPSQKILLLHVLGARVTQVVLEYPHLSYSNIVKSLS
jgi:hypothetical protein